MIKEGTACNAERKKLIADLTKEEASLLYKYAKGTHEGLLSGIRRRIVDKFTSLKVAFRNISKGTAAIKVADLRGVIEDLDPTISKADLSRVRAPHPPRVLPARLSQPPRPPARAPHR